MPNKSEILSNIIEDSETSNDAYKKEESSNIRCLQTKTRKPHIVKSLTKVKYNILIIGESRKKSGISIAR
jgi:hypothetical protein